MTRDKNQKPSTLAQHEHAFPLISIMQLITFYVALLTCVDFRTCMALLSESIGDDFTKACFNLGPIAILGFLVGAPAGLREIRRWSSMLICGYLGATVVLLIVATFVAPASPIQAATACLLPIISTVILRFRTP